ncbi:efflux RND transporter permease subunit [Pleionea sp. CnH1-48]|uniref:efflux RND transporter permease subunit n=1 Tax=Pleionea sp. CnH1-48 TaxID=2954494 RepID=UPI0020975BCD|nr:efflux RND transporter permease subunit [Pleionea sp. CnH1-48]MCO7223564.1 efflux RND transporter permease subunit [Pleionea sp. CnH1-48]
MWLKKLIENHVLTNLLFLLTLIVGIGIYQQMPREQDPSVNFNWVQITTFLPGATASDVEKKVTNVIEEALEKVQDIKFVSSTSRESLSSVLVRFHDISTRQFDKRIADLRREINTIEDNLPEEVERPNIFEVTTANAFPTATVVVSGPADDENLRRQARLLEKDLARIPGVDRVQPTALRDPELQIRFYPEKLQQLGLTPADIIRSVRAFYQDVSAGTARVAQKQWLIRVEGTTTDPDRLAALPILSNNGNEVRLSDIAQVERARAKAQRIVRFQGRPAVLFAVMKQADFNTLDLVDRIDAFITERNQLSDERGVAFVLVDDQTQMTRSALSVMQTNALFGLLFVFAVTWFFLSTRISLLVTIGIPFTLAGTFITLHLLGQTLNTSVLLGIVIALGMLVDDAVVVVESIHRKLLDGVEGIQAAWQGLTEVIGPVTASVLTTMAAFLPLMLLPGILGKFMFVIPLVVTTALAISLIEAYWMLPSHIMSAKVSFKNPTKMELFRQNLIRKVRIKYGVTLLKMMRHPRKTLSALVVLFVFSLMAPATGIIRMDFFASDTLRLFYINIDMPTSSSLDNTIEKVMEAENIALAELQPEETRSLVSYAGQAFTETAPAFGEHLGQVLVSLNPQSGSMRSVDSIIEELRPKMEQIIGPSRISFLTISGGPPTSKPVSLKVRGDDFNELRRATDALQDFLRQDGRFKDVTDDDSIGRNGLNIQIDSDAANRLGIHPSVIQQTIKSLVDGEIISYVQHQGDQVAVRLRSLTAVQDAFDRLDEVLNFSLPAADGSLVPLQELLIIKSDIVKGNIRHYNFQRTITLESDIDKTAIDTIQANELIKEHWLTIAKDYPNASLDFSGELDDIQESLDAIFGLFLFGVGLMYLILSTQFQSYFQPFMILMTLPLAFIGVVVGLLVSGNPLSLFTMYGIVALAGIAVNAAIVLISTANQNLTSGMSLTHATFYAARRRLLPIMITTLTTIAGLFSLASGLGGASLLWSPVATAIVWGLLFSSFLTLFVIPILYQLSMSNRANTKPH